MKRNFAQKISVLNKTVLECYGASSERYIIKKFTEAGISVLGADFGCSWLKQPKGDLVLGYKSKSMPYTPKPPRKNEGVNAQIQRSRTPLLIADVWPNPKVKSDSKVYMRAIAGVPMVYRQHNYGNIIYCFKRPHAFTEEERIICEYIGSTTAQALTIHRLYASVEELRRTLDHAADPILLLEPEQLRVLYANQVVKKHLGVSEKSLLNRSVTELETGIPFAEYNDIIQAVIQEPGERRVFETEVTFQNKEAIPVEVSLEHVATGGGSPRLLATVRNIAELKKAQSEVKRSAYYDRLTGLPNRAYLLEELPKIVERSKAEKRQFALCVVDVDKFQFINDLLGHESADELLAEIAKRLWNAADKRNTVVRTSSDEFAVVLDPIKSVQDVELVASEIQRAFQEPFVMQDQEVFISISCGIAIFPGDGQTMQTLMQNASSALRWVKESGGGSFRHYYGDMSGISPERLHFAQELRQALRKGNLQVLFDLAVQSAGKGAVFAFSSIYLKTKQAELLPLQELLTLPESSSLALEVGYWHIREALRVVRQWQADSAAEVCVCVPVSRKQLLQPDFATTVAGMVAAADVPPSALLLEVEEGAVMQNLDELLGVLGQLEGMGVRLIVGGFGRGYISLPHVHRMPIEYVRLDAEFTQGLNMNAHSDAIVSALISFAHDLGIGVVASGITSKAQARYLREKKCDVLCGSWVSAPLAPDEAARFLRDKSWMRKLS